MAAEGLSNNKHMLQFQRNRGQMQTKAFITMTRKAKKRTYNLESLFEMLRSPSGVQPPSTRIAGRRANSGEIESETPNDMQKTHLKKSVQINTNSKSHRKNNH